jgi:DNA-directed RNA polymerase subunit M
MEFCPKCGNILEQAGKSLKCGRCGYRKRGKGKIESTEKIKEKKEVGVIKDKDTDVFPTTNAVCPECGNEEAYTWSAQTRAADEAETRFFKCTKCEKTWRVYD